MANERAVALVEETLEKTRAKKLQWKTTAHKGVFIVPMGGKYIISIARAGSGVGMTLSDGDTLLLECGTASIPNANNLTRLYDLVENQVLRADEKKQSIDDAISVLKNL